MPSTPFRPRWVYNDGSAIDYSMTIAQREWGYGSKAEGGSDVSAAGVPSAFVVRRDYLLRLRLRFPAYEWPDVERLVRHLQEGGSATYYPDRDVTTRSHTVYGDKPGLADEIQPTRGEDPETLELAMTVRRTTSTIFTDEFHGRPPTFVSIVAATGTDAGGTAVTITGTEFQPGALVTIGGAAATSIVIVSRTSITIVTPAGTAGARDVVVTNPDGQAVTGTGAFTYT